jgi:two-component system, NtrC family, response regulator HydG
MAKILVIEDNDTMREGMLTIINKMGHEVVGAAGGQDGVRIFEDEGGIDFVLTDLKMEGLDGIAVLEKVKAANPDCVVVIITAYGTIETAVEAIKKGAFDFMTKPFSQEVLRMKVNQALEFAELRTAKVLAEEETEYLRTQERDRYGFEEMIGSSDAMCNIIDTIKKVSASDSSIFIEGESGTGKELIARAIHYSSPRAEKPFVKVNCSALAESLLESELFGHEKGSFTGAIKRKIGRFELADKGTLFLDEIGDISPMIQLKLLRVLQEREFERVGGNTTIHVDVRVICATNKNLVDEIAKGNFREDLYYRLHIVPIEIPPLRDRKEDIPDLVVHFLKKLSKRTRKKIKSVAPEAMRVLREYNWPGNIRELENVIEQSMVLCEEDQILQNSLPSFVSNVQSLPSYRMQLGKKPLNEILEDLERELIKEAYEKAGRVKTETARLLGVKTSALYYKLEKYGLI